MNRLENALRELGEMDTLADGRSPVHALHPLVKLALTLCFILLTVSCGKYEAAPLAALALYPALLFQLSGVPVRTCFRKLRYVLPLVLAVGVLNPFFDRTLLPGLPFSGGVLSMLTLMVKGVLCLSVSFLLMATTRIEALCGGLRQLRVPALPVTLLLLTWRYAGVLVEEAAVMTDAYHLRAPEQKGVQFSAWGSFLGQLLLRSMDRAEDLYASMKLRGYRGEFPAGRSRKLTRRDLVWLAGGLAILAALRYVPFAQALGQLIVR